MASFAGSQPDWSCLRSLSSLAGLRSDALISCARRLPPLTDRHLGALGDARDLRLGRAWQSGHQIQLASYRLVKWGGDDIK
jgi:hypothetical protein